MILSSRSDAPLQAGMLAVFARQPPAPADKRVQILGGVLVTALHLLLLAALAWSVKSVPVVQRDAAFMIDFVRLQPKAPEHLPVPVHMAVPRKTENIAPPSVNITPAAALAAPPDVTPAKPEGTGGSGAAMAGGGASSSALPDATGENDGGYLELLRRHIASFMGDPHVEGEVTLRFSIDRQGKLLSYEIVKSSGDWHVDEAAVEMLRRAQPLPPIPDALNVPGLRVTMPLKYRL